MKITYSEYKALLSLLSTLSPSSAECEVSRYIESYCNGVCLYQSDILGNAFLSLPGISNKTIMIAAHSDEIGLQVVHITAEGYIRFRLIGGVDVKSIVGRQVFILSGDKRVAGVICKVPIHIELKEKVEKQLEVSDLWIDIGCENDKEARQLVSIGDMIGFAPNTVRIGHTKLSAKALDNKLGVFIVSTAIKRLSKTKRNNNITAVLTVQEEVGSKGAIIAAETILPSCCICIDAGVATDCPGISEDKYGSLILGKGPALVYCMDTNRQITDFAAKILEKNSIKYQKCVGLYSAGGTDTNKIQITGKGVPCILMSIPLRSMHTPSEVCDLRDISNAIDAIVAIVHELDL